MVSRYEAEKQELTNEIIAVQRERDDSLLLAENEKQQVNPNIGDLEKSVKNFFHFNFISSIKTTIIINLQWLFMSIFFSVG